MNSLKGKGFEVKSFKSNEEASCYILENLNDSYTIFLKASRSMKFEEILENMQRGYINYDNGNNSIFVWSTFVYAFWRHILIC